MVVAGANGRVGSMVCRHLLRTQPGVRVRALVRSADRTEDYARLSYEVGAEEARYALRPAWSLAPEEDGGGLAWPTQAQFDPQIQGDYGLERLELVPCELRHEDDLKAALRGADAMIYCATDFSAGRRRIPQQLDNALAGISKFGADLFELRLPGFGRGLPGRGEGGRNEEEESRLARLESIRAFGSETIDDRGVALAAAVVAEEIGRKARIAALTSGRAPSSAMGSSTNSSPTPFVLASASAALGYDVDGFDASGQEVLQENEFGYRKRIGEANLREALRKQQVPYAIVRLAQLDTNAPSPQLGEGLPLRWVEGDVAEEVAVKLVHRAEEVGADVQDVGAMAGRRQDELRGCFIAPRDAAAALVEALVRRTSDGSDGFTCEVFTQTREERAKDTK